MDQGGLNTILMYHAPTVGRQDMLKMIVSGFMVFLMILNSQNQRSLRILKERVIKILTLLDPKDIKVKLMECSQGRMLSFQTVYTGKQQTTSLEIMDNF